MWPHVFWFVRYDSQTLTTHVCPASTGQKAAQPALQAWPSKAAAWPRARAAGGPRRVAGWGHTVLVCLWRAMKILIWRKIWILMQP